MKSLIVFLLVATLPAADFAVTPDEITEEWLIDCGSKTGYTNHIPLFKIIFDEKKIDTFLEFGLGFATKYFLDHCDRVISVEFVTNGCGPDWLKDCLELYQDIPNWIPIAYFSDYREDFSWAPRYFMASKAVYEANSYQSATYRDYSIIDSAYYKELNEFIEALTKGNRISLAFVDPGIVLRGDLVQLLFGKVSLIVAHDCLRRCDIKDDVYGYGRIKPPEDYEEINCLKQHSTIWIQKTTELKKLASILKKYSEQTEESERILPAESKDTLPDLQFRLP